jgi:copper(I)-binding protein
MGAMRKRRRSSLTVALAALALLAAGCSSGDAGTGTVGNAPVIHVAGAWALPGEGGDGTVYFTMHNGGGAEDRLLEASTPAAGSVEIQQAVTEGGEGQSQPVDSVAIAPDQEIVFEPGGYGLALVGVTQPLEMGSVVSVALTFEKAGVVDLEAIVSKHAPPGGMDMGGMTGSS